MYNPRFPHTLSVKRIHRANGEIVYDSTGAVTFDSVPLSVVVYSGNEPQRIGDGSYLTETATSVNFGYRSNNKGSIQGQEVLVNKVMLATPMLLTALLNDDVLTITDYDRTYEASLVKKVTTNLGTNLWIEEVQN